MGRQPKQWDKMSREEYLRESLRQAHRDADEARTAKSWQAVTHCVRLARQFRGDLEQHLAEVKRAEDDELTEEELLHELLAAVEELPLEHVEKLEAAVRTRLGT